MTNLILRLFVKDYNNVKNPSVRARYGIVASVVGILCNSLLAALKFFLGIITNSVAITADAVNNLSDSASSIVTLVGFRLAAKPADRDHPFGHGRIEYICGLAVGIFVLFVGYEAGRAAVVRLFSDSSVRFSAIAIVGLSASILVKLWLVLFNKALSKKTGSATMNAVATDSLSDALSTTVTLIAVIASRFTSFPFDGIIGILVCLFVLRAGFGIIKDTLKPLLGTTPDPELVKKIGNAVLSHDKILGIHDLIIHEYGPGKLFASLHAEVSSKEDIMETHGVIDHIEAEVSSELGIDLVLHMDPLETECEETQHIRNLTIEALKKLDDRFSIHDFRIVPSGNFKNILFDVVVPIDYPAPNKIISDMVETAVSSIDQSFIVKPMVDREYIK